MSSSTTFDDIPHILEAPGYIAVIALILAQQLKPDQYPLSWESGLLNNQITLTTTDHVRYLVHDKRKKNQWYFTRNEDLNDGLEDIYVKYSG